MAQPIKLILGMPYPWPKEYENEYLQVLSEYNVRDLDTGSTYPGSEQFIGDSGISTKFAIHTKPRGWVPGVQSYHDVMQCASQSFERLQIEKVETYILHSPDPSTPLSETYRAIQQLYEQGRFEKLGVSNFPAADLRKLYDYAKSNNLVLPSVYEGYYNPVGRHADSELFPLLHELGMSFYAYGVLAGGFLVKSAQETIHGSEGRWDASTGVGKMHQKIYGGKATLEEGLKMWEAIAQEFAVSKASLAYRWVAFNSNVGKAAGDGVIMGASNPKQLRALLQGIAAGPLSEAVVARIDTIWEVVKGEAILDNFNRG